MTPDQLQREKIKADLERIDPAELSAVLAAHQAGDDTAADRLRRGHRYILWERVEAFRPSRHIRLEDVLGVFAEDLAVAVTRLRYSGTVADVERRIRDELRHTPGHYADELRQGDTLKGDTLGELPRTRNKLREVPSDEGGMPGDLIRLLDDPEVRPPACCPDGSPYRVPSRLEQRSPHDELEAADEAEATYRRLAPVARSPLERRIVEALRDGAGVCEISDRLRGVHYAKIETAMMRLERRAAGQLI